jgi:endoglucanase
MILGASWRRRYAALLGCFLALGMTGRTGNCAPAPWPLWDAYAARFIDGQGRVIDPQGGGRTTSEGQSYAMFFALSNNDRIRFDQLLHWTQVNMAAGNMGTHLPGWLWGKAKDGQWKQLDVNPAADSDVWIAYSLEEAGRLWNNSAYTTLARQMMHQIAKQEVAELPGFGLMLMPGPTPLFAHKQSWTVNPSYVPVFIFERFAAVDPAGPWGAIALNIPRLVKLSSRQGFAMDWTNWDPNGRFIPAPAPGLVPKGKTAPPPVGSYDAIRVYLWAGMTDPGGQTRAELVTALSGMGAYISNHGAPPEKVSDQGQPSAQDGPVGFSASALPYLRALPQMDKAEAQQRARIRAQLDPATGLYGKDPAYYDQNLVLFATGFLDGRFLFGPRGELRVEWTR